MLYNDICSSEEYRPPGSLLSEHEFWNICDELMPGDICPWCRRDVVVISHEDEYTGEYLICPRCYSDYAYYREEDTLFEYNVT